MNTFYLRRIESVAQKFCNNQKLDTKSSNFLLWNRNSYNYNVFYLKNQTQMQMKFQHEQSLFETSASQKSQKIQSQPSKNQNIVDVNNSKKDSIFETHQQEILSHLKSAAAETTSFFFMNKWAVKTLAEEFKTKYPNVTPFYAVRNSPFQSIVSAVLECGIGMACDSQKEVEIVDSVQKTHFDYQNTPKDKLAQNYQIHFTNPVQEESEILQVVQNDPYRQIQYFYADTMDELIKLKDTGVTTSSDPNRKLVWNFRFISNKQQTPTDSFDDFTSFQYGEDVSRVDQVEKRLNAINKLNLKLSGLKLNCSGCADKQNFIKFVLESINAATTLGHMIEMINLDASQLESLKINQTDLQEIIQRHKVKITVNLQEDYFSGVGCGVFKVLKKKESIGAKSFSLKESILSKLFWIMNGKQMQESSNQVIESQDVYLPENLYSSISQKQTSEYAVVPKQNLDQSLPLSKINTQNLVPTNIFSDCSNNSMLPNLMFPKTLRKDDLIVLSSFGSGFYYRQAQELDRQLDVVFLSKQKDALQSKQDNSEETGIEIETI